MVAVDLKGVNQVRKRLADGSMRLYFYHRGSGKRLTGVPGSAQFLADYQDAERVAPRDAGTVGGLMREYQASPKFVSKPLSTRREYKRMLTHLETKFGTMPVVALASPRVIGKFIDYQEEIGRDRPRDADNRLTILSAVFSYALRKGRIARNPLKGFERLYDGDRSDKI
ncbi:hypothetical protein ACFSCV_10105 [Methylopila henanensis]|uniref:Core-binding (CB) domain-containing protein n=1 Tax=Methylopila henanensis TaxID=873516 RepID=A0ABW4K5B0_9HYPH